MQQTFIQTHLHVYIGCKCARINGVYWNVSLSLFIFHRFSKGENACFFSEKFIQMYMYEKNAKCCRSLKFHLKSFSKGFGALAALKRKRKKFSKSRNTSPVLEPSAPSKTESSPSKKVV